MKDKHCSICMKDVERDDLPVLTMGAGVPRLLCEECAALMDTATMGKDYDAIKSAMDEITAKMSAAGIDDRLTVETVTLTFGVAAERAVAIKEGKWDFALDAAEAEGLDDIPEELAETEEDKQLDARDEKRGKVIDSVLTWVMAGVLTAAIAFMVWFFFFR